MENKYYTPTIEEFHVGFEYEVSDLSDNGKDWTWRKQVFDGEETRTYFIDELNKKEIRVKQLDREDIESLGWKHQEDNFFYHKNYELLLVSTSDGDNIQIHDQSPYQEGAKRNERVFWGVLKNKSELKKLMQQLKIG